MLLDSQGKPISTTIEDRLNQLETNEKALIQNALMLREAVKNINLQILEMGMLFEFVINQTENKGLNIFRTARIKEIEDLQKQGKKTEVNLNEE